jgi:hypothetical protein
MSVSQAGIPPIALRFGCLTSWNCSELLASARTAKSNSNTRRMKIHGANILNRVELRFLQATRAA